MAEIYETHKLDTQTFVFFYEQDHYYLSNFSSFRIDWKNRSFDTVEHVYHWEKFNTADRIDDNSMEATRVQWKILQAHSAHEAFQVAQENKHLIRHDWHDVKFGIMKEILREKIKQHPYVRAKLPKTGDRTLVEDSWRDSIWGWGPNKDGQNMLGKIWMELRAELANEAA